MKVLYHASLNIMYTSIVRDLLISLRVAVLSLIYLPWRVRSQDLMGNLLSLSAIFFCKSYTLSSGFMLNLANSCALPPFSNITTTVRFKIFSLTSLRSNILLLIYLVWMRWAQLRLEEVSRPGQRFALVVQIILTLLQLKSLFDCIEEITHVIILFKLIGVE